MQDDTLFAGSIADNICFFDSNPDMDRIIHCASMANLHADINQMPMTYQTLVGDMGTTPLHVAIGQKNQAVIDALLKAGARTHNFRVRRFFLTVVFG